jgi:hypothetical protein
MRGKHNGYFMSWVCCLSMIFCSGFLSAAVEGFHAVSARSGLEEIYGSAITSEGYARIGTQEDYDPGAWVFFWNWRLSSRAEVQNSLDRARAGSTAPEMIGGWVQTGGVELDIIETIPALAWTSAKNIYSSDAAKTVDVSFYRRADHALSSSLTGDIKFYFGIWENDITAANLMLTEKDGWTLSQLNYKGTPLTLLQQTHTAGSAEVVTDWNLAFSAGKDYTFFSYMVAEVVPEPTTIFLLGTGAFLMQRKRKN